MSGKDPSKHKHFGQFPTDPSVPSSTTRRYWQDVMSIEPSARPGSSSMPPPPPRPPSSSYHPKMVGSSGKKALKPPRPASVRQFHCKLCPSRFERRGHLDSHVETVHEGKRPFPCSRGCGKVFGHRSSLSRHIKTVHDNPDHESNKNKNKGSSSKHHHHHSHQ